MHHFIFPSHWDRFFRVKTFFLSLPHSKRKFEQCCSSVHSLRIASKMTSQSLAITALLHDVFEDFGEHKSILNPLSALCSSSELHDITTLSKTLHESYSQYIGRVKQYPNSRLIKIYDICDNFPSASYNNQIKYLHALQVLIQQKTDFNSTAQEISCPQNPGFNLYKITEK